MDIGNPIIFNCPLCGKSMQMTTFTSCIVSSSKYFSDGNISQSGICCPDFTPDDLAKCPHCKALFFRYNVKDAKSVNFYTNKVKEDIEDPEREDLINAVKNKIAKNQQEEKEIREMLWHDFNKETRHGYNQLNGDELKIWQENCAALLRLAEKTLKEMQSEKNSEKYNNNDRENCILTIAELNRNLGNFDKCMELINELGSKWGWLKKQFAWECKAKNIFTFQLMTKNEMNLEKAKNQCGEDYFNRAQNFLPPYYGRRNLKKVLADFKKAEDLGMKGISFYRARGDIYLEELNDPDSAIADFSKALKQKDKNKRNKNYISGILSQRSSAYLKKGNYKKALAEIQTALDNDNDNENLYTMRAKIHEAMGNKEAAESDKLTAKTLIKKRQEWFETIKKKPVKISSKKGIIDKGLKKKRTKNKISEL